ncbi:hypothetical protein NL676_002492 [Syzygium grande]|nr:hypothetical protein NL676_002492 [Syzygium grande]
MYLGFCFAPTGEEHYLYLVKKVKGMRILSYLIPKHDIYEEEPWKMFDHFMTLKKIKSRVQWTAGQGTWKGQNRGGSRIRKEIQRANGKPFISSYGGRLHHTDCLLVSNGDTTCPESAGITRANEDGDFQDWIKRMISIEEDGLLLPNDSCEDFFLTCKYDVKTKVHSILVNS